MPRVFQKYKEEYKEEARKRILDAALELVKKKGYQSMTLDDVAGEVGVTKGTLYLYFKNKEELFRAVSLEMAKSFEETMKYTFVDSDDLDTVLDCMISQIITFSKNFGIENNIALVSEWIAIAARDQAARSMFIEMFHRNAQIFEDGLRVSRKKNWYPRDLDLHAATQGILALTGVVKFGIFLGENESEIKKWWITSAKKLLDVPVTS